MPRSSSDPRSESRGPGARVVRLFAPRTASAGSRFWSEAHRQAHRIDGMRILVTLAGLLLWGTFVAQTGMLGTAAGHHLTIDVVLAGLWLFAVMVTLPLPHAAVIFFAASTVFATVIVTITHHQELWPWIGATAMLAMLCVVNIERQRTNEAARVREEHKRRAFLIRRAGELGTIDHVPELVPNRCLTCGVINDQRATRCANCRVSLNAFLSDRDQPKR